MYSVDNRNVLHDNNILLYYRHRGKWIDNRNII